MMDTHLHDPFAALTPTQRAMLPLIARGATDQEIAQALGRTAVAVTSSLRDIYRKVGVNNRTEVAALYMGLRPWSWDDHQEPPSTLEPPAPTVRDRSNVIY